MTAPDTDVRLWCRPTPAKARGAGRFALARLLLQALDHLLQLDRKLLLLFTVSSLSACIIPVGPQFQDPPGDPNTPPQILDPDPTWGAEVTAPETGATFTITVIDPTPTDQGLFIRFLVDNELTAIVNTVPPSAGSVRATVSNTITCQLIPMDRRTFSQHSVLAAVADNMFDIDVQDNLTAKPPGLVSSPVTWTLNITCSMMNLGSPQ